MKTRIFLCSVVLFSTPFFLSSTLAAPSSIPSSLRETNALNSELEQIKRECDASRNLTNQLRQTTRSTRKDVETAIRATSSLRSLEKRMARLISRLKPYESIPKVRTAAKFLRKNLIRVHGKLKKLRYKTDRFEASVLKPLRKKLIAVESKLRTAESKIKEVATATATSQSQLAQTARIANRNRHTRQGLESASRDVRPVARDLRLTLAEVNSEVRSVVSDLRRMQSLLSSFRTVDRSLAKLSKDLKPGEKVAADIDRVLSKRLEIRLPIPPFKKVGFSVRTILEKPGEVMGVILKPLEKLADKILEPVLKKAKLEIKMPAGLAAMERSMSQINSMNRGVMSKLDQLDAKLSGKLVRDANRFLASTQRKLSNLANRR